MPDSSRTHTQTCWATDLGAMRGDGEWGTGNGQAVSYQEWTKIGDSSSTPEGEGIARGTDGQCSGTEERARWLAFGRFWCADTRDAGGEDQKRERKGPRNSRESAVKTTKTSDASALTAMMSCAVGGSSDGRARKKSWFPGFRSPGRGKNRPMQALQNGEPAHSLQHRI